MVMSRTDGLCENLFPGRSVLPETASRRPGWPKNQARKGGDSQAISSDRRQMRFPDDNRYLTATGGKFWAEIAADAAISLHRDFHVPSGGVD